MAVTFIVSFPIAAILDKILGEEIGDVMSKSTLKKIFADKEMDAVLDPEEKRILLATLDL